MSFLQKLNDFPLFQENYECIFQLYRKRAFIWYKNISSSIIFSQHHEQIQIFNEAYFNILIIKKINVPDIWFRWILDMLFYRILTINSEKISLVVFFVAFGPFLSYFYPPISLALKSRHLILCSTLHSGWQKS